jgi:hypothetical protein
MYVFGQLSADEALPRIPRMGGLRHRSLHVEMEYRFRAAMHGSFAHCAEIDVDVLPEVVKDGAKSEYLERSTIVGFRID